jgi:hypothetical protein
MSFGDGAPPLMEGVKISPNVRVEVHEAKPIFEAISNLNGVSTSEN